MKRLFCCLTVLLTLSGCGEKRTVERVEGSATAEARNLPEPTARPVPATAPPNTSETPSSPLAVARRGFQTKVTRRLKHGTLPELPPADLFRVVQYSAPQGKLAAYLSPEPGGTDRRPAIIWITGGDCNSIGRGCWDGHAPPFDQSASEYRKAGIIMMFPALRGGNDNPEAQEGYYGEVDDILAAARFLREQSFVDPYRIYLGGHSTGGTLALLTAECSPDFRAIFAFGAVADPSSYPPQYNPFGRSDPDKVDPKEVQLRAPVRWLEAIRTPVFVIDGTEGNLSDLKNLERSTKNPNLHCLAVDGTDHFRLLSNANAAIARKILADTGPACNMSLTEKDISGSERP